MSVFPISVNLAVGIWCCVRTHKYTHVHKHTCAPLAYTNTHTAKRRQQAMQRCANSLVCSPFLSRRSFSSDCVCLCVSVLGEFSSHGDPVSPCLLLLFSFCFTATRKDENRLRYVCYFSRPFCGLRDQPALSRVFLRSLALSGGFPTSTRTHARTHRDLHSQYIYRPRG